MDSQKQQAAERIKQANNILVTVSSNPSVDQLAACIGLTLALNKTGKHATAVFSGAVPSTIEFLQPEKTIEKNTDSLRDFIIALDKSKADKLRYKVEDRVVKIFITPYRTSINEKDLEFSQGDFNVDVVLALGVHSQAELDQAITAHGRILHDATVITMNVKPGGELGGINWLDPNASSLSELAVQLIDLLDKKLTDGQIATALLTGIVAETDRFSNAKTSSQTMTISAELMGAGANQQLVATKLEEPAPPPPQPTAPIAQQPPAAVEESKPPADKPDDGTLEIAHDEKPAAVPAKEEPGKAEEPVPQPAAIPEEKQEPIAPQIHIDEHGALKPAEPEAAALPPRLPDAPAISHHAEPPKMILEPPTMGGHLTASAEPASFNEPEGAGLPQLEPPAAASLPNPEKPSSGPTLVPPTAMAGEEMPSGGAAPADSFLVSDRRKDIAPEDTKTNEPLSTNGKTLSDIERDVHSSHLGPIPDSGTQQSTPSPSLQLNPPAAPLAPPDATLPPIPAPTPTGQAPNPMFTDTPAFPAPSISTPPDSNAPASVTPAETPDVDSARDAVAQAINGSATPQLEPIQSLNAQPIDLPLGSNAPDQPAPAGLPAAPAAVSPGGFNPAPAPANTALSLPGQPSFAAGPVPEPSPFSVPDLVPQPFPQPAAAPQDQIDPNAPPPVPPPMMPPANPY